MTFRLDLASRAFGGAVVAASDESFCAKENLIEPRAPVFTPRTYDRNGQVYDGWETRRRREPGHDHAVVRLGAPGVIGEIVVDTAFFTGNFPERCTIEAARVDGYDWTTARWTTLIADRPLKGDLANAFPVTDGRRYTHVRLSILPDGGVARLRVYGEVVPDPDLLAVLPADVAALANGGRVVDCSDAFYSSPDNLLMPGLARVTGDGWETRRRRDDGNDWVLVRLAAPADLRVAELDTSQFRFNATGWGRLTGRTPDGDDADLLARTRLWPDTVHRFVLPDGLPAVDHVRLDAYPDGGMARLRLLGTVTPAGLTALRDRWTATA